MAQIVKISRGKLSSKLTADLRLMSGELFFDKESKTVYMGDGAETGTDGKHFPLAGLNTLRWAGKVTELPVAPKYGDMFEVATGFSIPDDGEGQALELNALDFLVYVYNDVDLENYDLGTSAKRWLRINNSGGSAVETSIDPTGTNLLPTSVDVQKAIVDLDRHKLAFGGLFVSEAACIPGHFYYVDQNTTQYISTDSGSIENDPNAIAGVSNGQVYLSRGNLLICTSDTVENGALVTQIKKYAIVDLGSNADDITIVTALTRRPGSDALTDYNDTDSVITNLQVLLQNIFTTKADLDLNGKIYLDQLPSTIIGAMEYQGTWAGKMALPTGEDKAPDPELGPTNADEDTVLGKGDYWIAVGTTFYITADGAITTEGAAGAIRVNNGDWLIVQSNIGGTVTWDVLSNDAVFKGIIADGVLHEGTPEIVGDGRATEVTSPAGGNTILVAAPKALVNVDAESEIGRHYQAADAQNNFKKSGLVESDTTLKLDGGKTFQMQRPVTVTPVPGQKETFTVTVSDLSPSITVDGTTYDLGAAIPGFNITINGDGTFTYTAQDAGAHVVAVADAVLIAETVGTDVIAEDFTVRHVLAGYTYVNDAETPATFTLDGTSYNVGNAVAGFSVTEDAGVYTYEATVSGAHTVAAGTGTVVNETTAGTADAQVTTLGATASVQQNSSQATAEVVITLPSKSGTLVIEEDLLKVTEHVSEDTVPVKVGDEFIDSPITQTRDVADAVDGIQVAGKVNLNNGTVIGTLTANPTVATVNALPETDGTLLNQNSTIDGGYFS